MNVNREKIMADFYKNLEEKKKIRSEVFFFDENGKSVDKVHAVKAIVREYNEKGELINETFANVGEEKEEEKNEEHRKA